MRLEATKRIHTNPWTLPCFQNIGTFSIFQQQRRRIWEVGTPKKWDLLQEGNFFWGFLVPTDSPTLSGVHQEFLVHGDTWGTPGATPQTIQLLCHHLMREIEVTWDLQDGNFQQDQASFFAWKCGVTPQNHQKWRYLRENRSDASGMRGFYQHLPTVLGLNMGKATMWTTRFPGVTDTATSRRDRKVHFLNGRCSGSVRVDLSSGGSGMLRILWRKLEIKPSKYPWKWTKVLNFWELLEKDQIKSQK